MPAGHHQELKFCIIQSAPLQPVVIEVVFHVSKYAFRLNTAANHNGLSFFGRHIRADFLFEFLVLMADLNLSTVSGFGTLRS